MKLERILCPLDFSECSAKAFDYAQSLAKHYRSKLFVQHVVQLVFSAYPSYVNPDVVNEVCMELQSHARNQLQEFVKSHTRDGVHIESVLDEGDVTDTILSFADAQAVDLIVMGTHGRHGLDHLLLGSITEKALRKARCPVLAVRRPTHEFVTPGDRAEPVHLRKILFCVDFSTYAERALRYALSLAQEYKAELTLLHVLEDFPISTDLPTATAEVVAKLETLLPSAARTGCVVKTRLRVGRPYEEIVRCATEDRTDLVILGVRGRNALDLALFGSTTHRVIQQGPCPVLAVHL